MINGTIEFELPGMSLGRNYGGNSGTRENLIHFTYNYNNEIHKIEEYVNNKILQIHNPQQNIVTQEKDNITQLKEAKELLDQGIITQEDFDQIKTKIMNNI